MSSLFAPVATTLPANATFVVRAGRQAVRAAMGVARAIAHRFEVRRLLELDDRMLKDIGLVRADVDGALAGPLARDPSVVLRLRSVEHRARAREHQRAAGRRSARVSELCD